MFDVLVTYAPFYRIHEIKTYFARNIRLLSPQRAVAYVDNVHTDEQKAMLARELEGIETVPGSWGDRNLTVLSILKDFRRTQENVLIVDSDNLLDPRISEFDRAMGARGFDYYNIMEKGFHGFERFRKRSINLGTVKLEQEDLPVYGYRVGGTKSGVFFIGRKQAVRIGRATLAKLKQEVISDCETALKRLPVGLRNYLTDETSMGFVYYYSGIRTVPWSVLSEHLGHADSGKENTPIGRLLTSITYSEFARGLPWRKYPRSSWMFLRYKASQLLYALLTL